MPKFVELWIYLSATPLFGLTATLVVYVLAHAFYTHVHQAPWANPVLWTVIFIAGGLLATDVPYQTYFSGAQFIHFLLGPAVVALAWPLWLRREELRKRWGKLLIAALAGGTAATLSVVLMGWAFGMPSDVLMSLVPKMVTAPVAMGIAEKIGGIPALAAVFAVLTGLVGALSGKYLFELIGLGTTASTTPNEWMIRGFALGASAHGIGAARAMQVNPNAGAYAGLALGLQVVLTTLLLPFIFKLVH